MPSVVVFTGTGTAVLFLIRFTTKWCCFQCVTKTHLILHSYTHTHYRLFTDKRCGLFCDYCIKKTDPAVSDKSLSTALTLKIIIWLAPTCSACYADVCRTSDIKQRRARQVRDLSIFFQTVGSNYRRPPSKRHRDKQEYTLRELTRFRKQSFTQKLISGVRWAWTFY